MVWCCTPELCDRSFREAQVAAEVISSFTNFVKAADERYRLSIKFLNGGCDP